MFCPNCGSNNETGKFCTKCGTPIPEFTENATNSSESQPNATVINQINTNEYVNKGKQVSKQYWSYFKENIRQPFAFSNTVDRNHFVNGLITLILTALLQALYTITLVKKTTRSFNSFFGDFGFSERDFGISLWGTFFKSFLQNAILYAIIVVVIFAVIKLINKSDVSFQDILARFGSYMAIPMLCHLLLFLGVLIGFGVLFNIILIVMVIIVTNLAIVFTAASYRANTNIDRYWTVVITLVLIVVALFIYGMMTADSILSNLEDAFRFF